MTEDKFELMCLLSEAAKNARYYSKTQFVFKEGSWSNWWTCGRLPDKSTEFYIAYPNGKFDRSVSAPELEDHDWEEFRTNLDSKWKAKQDSLIPDSYVPASPKPTGPCFEGSAPQPEAKSKLRKKILLGLFAFSPFLGFVVATLASTPQGLVMFMTFSAIPMTLAFLAMVFLQKSRNSAACFMLLGDCHLFFYGMVYFLTKISASNETDFIVIFMGTLIGSGIALLMAFDLDRRLN